MKWVRNRKRWGTDTHLSKILVRRVNAIKQQKTLKPSDPDPNPDPDPGSDRSGHEEEKDGCVFDDVLHVLEQIPLGEKMMEEIEHKVFVQIKWESAKAVIFSNTYWCACLHFSIGSTVWCLTFDLDQLVLAGEFSTSQQVETCDKLKWLRLMSKNFDRPPYIWGSVMLVKQLTERRDHHRHEGLLFEAAVLGHMKRGISLSMFAFTDESALFSFSLQHLRLRHGSPNADYHVLARARADPNNIFYLDRNWLNRFAYYASRGLRFKEIVDLPHVDPADQTGISWTSWNHSIKVRFLCPDQKTNQWKPVGSIQHQHQPGSFSLLEDEDAKQKHGWCAFVSPPPAADAAMTVLEETTCSPADISYLSGTFFATINAGNGDKSDDDQYEKEKEEEQEEEEEEEKKDKEKEKEKMVAVNIGDESESTRRDQKKRMVKIDTCGRGANVPIQWMKNTPIQKIVGMMAVEAVCLLSSLDIIGAHLSQPNTWPATATAAAAEPQVQAALPFFSLQRPPSPPFVLGDDNLDRNKWYKWVSDTPPRSPPVRRTSLTVISGKVQLPSPPSPPQKKTTAAVAVKPSKKSKPKKKK